jgi:hypothetical protein
MKTHPTPKHAVRAALALAAFLSLLAAPAVYADDCAGNLAVSCEPSFFFGCTSNCSNSPSAGGGTVYVMPFSSCTWTATPTVSWIHIGTIDTGSSPQSFTYTTDANTGSTPRSGQIAVSGKSFTVRQGGTSTLASGHVTTAGGSPVSGVLIDFTDGTPDVTTDSNGFWQQTGFATCNFTWAYPSKTGYTFSPFRLSVSSGQTDRNFTAIPQ